jgi:hypothetical protein
MFSEFSFKIAITTDIWTSIANRPYLAITAHFIDVKRNLKQVLIEFCYIPHPHGGEQVKNALIKTLNKYNILKKVITITSDNAMNNIKGLNLLNEYLESNLGIESVCHFPCFAHVLNFINEGIKDLAKVLSNLRKLGAVMKGSSSKSQAFEETTKANNHEYVKLKQDIYIRWNSTYDMAEKAIKMKRIIQIMCINHEEFNLYSISEEEWNNLETISVFLKPFYEATIRFGHKYSSINFVLPLLKALKDHSKLVLNELLLKKCSEMILIKLEKYETRLKNDLSLFAAILDPRLNFAYLKFILKSEEYESITKKFNEKFSDCYKKYSTPTKTTTIETAGPSILQSIYKKQRFNNTEEVENYSKISQEDSGINPIEWWKMHECIYPCLSKLAFDVLCIPATSVPSEQVAQ